MVPRHRMALLIAVAVLLTGCGRGREKAEDYYPETADGVHDVSFSYHIQEPMFAGHWGAPVLGEDQRFHRTLGEGGARIRFHVPRPERYVLNIVTRETEARLTARIGDTSFPLDRSFKHLPADLLKTGRNTLTLAADRPVQVLSLKLYPARVLKYARQRELLSDPAVLFLPGSLIYRIRPLPGEEICLKLDLVQRREIEVRVTIESEEGTVENTRSVKHDRRFRIAPLKDRYQTITLTPLPPARGYLRVAESFLTRGVRTTGNDSPGRETLRERVSGKNVLIVLLDAARRDHVGHQGYQRDTTPHLDDLSKGAIVFRNAYSEASYTLASTATLLTGLPPDFHGVVARDYSSLDPKTATLGQLFQANGYFSGAISGNPNFGRAFRMDRGFSEFIELFKARPVALAGDFIAPFRGMLDRIGDRPFFIYLHIREPHDPFAAPPPFLGHFQDTYQEQSAALAETGKTFWNSTVRPEDDLPLLRKLYDENLYYGDWAAGRILDILAERGLDENTVKVFLSDHGEAIGENGQIGHGHVLYETGINIPLFIQIPGVEPRILDRPAITSDLVLTLADLFGLDYPYHPFSRGRYLFDLPETRRLVARRILIKNYPGYTVLQYPHKLILHFPIGEHGGELFDLSRDPGETTPLEGHRRVRDTLRFYLFNHLKKAVHLHPEILRPTLSEEDLKSLESLGYMQ